MDGVTSGRSTKVFPSLSKNLYKFFDATEPLSLLKISKNSNVGVWILWYPYVLKTLLILFSSVNFIAHSLP